jgi:hypothetical protein
MGSQRGELSNLSNSIVVDDPGASGKEDRRTHIPVVIGIPDDDDAKGCRTPAYLRQLTTPIHQFRYLSSLNSWSTHPAYITGRRQNEIGLNQSLYSDGLVLFQTTRWNRNLFS